MRTSHPPVKPVSFRGLFPLPSLLLLSMALVLSSQVASSQVASSQVAPGQVASDQAQPPSPAQAIRTNFTDVHRKLLEMALDFPADKYDYRPAKGVRSFGEVILHASSGLVYAAKKGRGEDVKWDETDTGLKTKAAIVAYIQRWSVEANQSLKAVPDDRFLKTLSPWIEVLEHSAEHYGQLVAYYRMNGLVPPESRPKGN